MLSREIMQALCQTLPPANPDAFSGADAGAAKIGIKRGRTVDILSAAFPKRNGFAPAPPPLGAAEYEAQSRSGTIRWSAEKRGILLHEQAVSVDQPAVGIAEHEEVLSGGQVVHVQRVGLGTHLSVHFNFLAQLAQLGVNEEATAEGFLGFSTRNLRCFRYRLGSGKHALKSPPAENHGCQRGFRASVQG